MDPGCQPPIAATPMPSSSGRAGTLFGRSLDHEVAVGRPWGRRARRGRRCRQAIEPQRNLGMNLSLPDRQRDSHRLGLLAAGRGARQPPTGDRLAVGARERDRQRAVRLFDDDRLVGGAGRKADGKQRRQLLLDLSRRGAAADALNLQREPGDNDHADHCAHSIGSVDLLTMSTLVSRERRRGGPAFRPSGPARRTKNVAGPKRGWDETILLVLARWSHLLIVGVALVGPACGGGARGGDTGGHRRGWPRWWWRWHFWRWGPLRVASMRRACSSGTRANLFFGERAAGVTQRRCGTKDLLGTVGHDAYCRKRASP